ncbi:immunoglobulin gamma-1 heavy chain-like [Cetorhinus maximus]
MTECRTVRGAAFWLRRYSENSEEKHVIDAVLSVVVSQAVFPQTPTVQGVSVGSTFKVHCHKGWFATGVVHWYKQRPGKRLELVYIARKPFPPEGRFSGEVNDESTIYSLVIEDVRRNDSGVYYCAAKKSTGTSSIFGNGSKLFIVGPPKIFLLSPPLDDILPMETIPLLCFVNSLAVDTLPLRWNISARITDGWTDSGTIGLDGTYSISSHIRVPAETCNNGAVCTCSVQINSTENLISESVSYQRDPPYDDCLLLLSGCSFLMILLLMISIVAVGCSYRNRRSGENCTV